MIELAAFRDLATTSFADALPREQVMRYDIRPLWAGMPRVVGRAYPVRCAPGDNLMLHAAIHRAPAESVVVVEAGDMDYAVAGGNVCAVAQRNGIAGFVVDGAIRDLVEIRERRFPVFARGVTPKPGAKNVVDVLNGPVTCGGVRVTPGDVIVADEEGIVVIPSERAAQVLEQAEKRARGDAAQALDAWEAEHRARIDGILRAKGFPEA